MPPHALLLDLPLPDYLYRLDALGGGTLAGRPPRPPRDDTGPPALGQRVHDAILEPAKVGEDWSALTATEGAQAADAAPDEADAIRAVLARDAFLRGEWGDTVRRGWAEATLVWRDAATDLWCKTRPDLIDAVGNRLVELKTVQRLESGDVIGFVSSPRNVLQSAMQRAGLRALTGRDWAFGWLMVELQAPRRTRWVELPLHLRRAGEWRLQDRLAAVRGSASGQAFDPVRWTAYVMDEGIVHMIRTGQGRCNPLLPSTEA